MKKVTFPASRVALVEIFESVMAGEPVTITHPSLGNGVLLSEAEYQTYLKLKTEHEKAAKK